MFRFLIIGLLGLSLSACATVTRGSNEAWEATSEPSGARVETSNGHMCTHTPCAIRMPRRSEFVATFTKDGYQTVEVHVTNRIAGAGAAGLAGNVLIGGIIGIGVDAYTGAALELVPNPAHVFMERLEEGEENIPLVIEMQRRETESDEDTDDYDPIG